MTWTADHRNRSVVRIVTPRTRVQNCGRPGVEALYRIAFME